MTDTKPTPYAWTVTGNAQMFFGDYAQHDAEYAAKCCGGTARAFPLFVAQQTPAKDHVEQRKVFEAWVRATHKPEEGWWCRQLPDGGYSSGIVDAAWKAWQAAIGYPRAPKPLTDDKVYEAIKGIDSLDALAVWRAAEAAHGITKKEPS